MEITPVQAIYLFIQAGVLLFSAYLLIERKWRILAIVIGASMIITLAAPVRMTIAPLPTYYETSFEDLPEKVSQEPEDFNESLINELEQLKQQSEDLQYEIHD